MTMPILLHGKQYVTVNERVSAAHEDLAELTITTEVLSHEPVVMKATVTTKKGVFTGTSAADPTKVIEKKTPYEVAETSAVGRALGFAGYGIVESIASAEEVMVSDIKSDQVQTREPAKQTLVKPATERQVYAINKMIEIGKLSKDIWLQYPDMTQQEATRIIGGAK